jgi:hypothetical protein
MSWFTAKFFAVEEMPDLNTLAVVLSENDAGSGERLEFQRALSFDESDVKIGMDTYCLVVSSGAAHYGGVLGWSVKERCLDLALDEAAVEELGLQQSVQIDLNVGAAGEAELIAGLQRILL